MKAHNNLMYAPNNTAQMYAAKTEGEMKKFVTITGDFNTPVINHTSRQKIQKN